MKLPLRQPFSGSSAEEHRSCGRGKRLDKPSSRGQLPPPSRGGGETEGGEPHRLQAHEGLARHTAPESSFRGPKLVPGPSSCCTPALLSALYSHSLQNAVYINFTHYYTFYCHSPTVSQIKDYKDYIYILYHYNIIIKNNIRKYIQYKPMLNIAFYL